jgi:ubiquinone/menaquinone biosynthesis C-methylase UbiE
MDPRAETIESWRSVADGWERRRDLIWSSTRVVSERMVELLDPQPGETILEIAAGAGDTGFLAAPRLEPGGRLLTTDAAPEMVEAAERRAAELRIEGGTFAVEDAAALTLADETVDGVLCRWGLMLVPEMDGAAREMHRVLRPGGRAVLAVWADPDRNDWMTATGRAAVELGLMERPDPAAPGPFRLAGDGRLATVLEGAGFDVATVEDVPMTWRATSLDDWWATVRDMSPTTGALLERVGPVTGEALREAAASRLARYVTADGAVEVPSVARVALATKREQA